MPNHLHGIIIINEDHRPTSRQDHSVGTHSRASLRGLGRSARSVGSIVAGLKSVATKRINLERRTPRNPVWQARFYDHVIRNDADLHRIRSYIGINPLQWALDEENPANFAV